MYPSGTVCLSILNEVRGTLLLEHAHHLAMINTVALSTRPYAVVTGCSAWLQDEGWRPSITVKNILTGIQVQALCQAMSPSFCKHY